METKENQKGGSSSKILIVIPAYNEANRVGNVIQAAKAYLPVLVVDDGSKDQTSQVASEAGAGLIRQEPNQGKGAALLKGFKQALELGYDAVITMDADGQHAADEIPLFIEEFKTKGSDLIIGKRDFSKMPFPRNITNRIGTWSFSNAMQQYIPDNQSGYRLHSRRLIEKTLSSSERGYEFEVEVILRCVLNDYKISWIPIKTIYNEVQNSKISPVKHAVRFYQLVARTGKIIREYKKARMG